MRPILSASGTFNYNLAKFLVSLIKPFYENEYTVSDSFDFLRNISEIENANDYVMVSFDVASLYTSVSVNETIEILMKQAFHHNEFFFMNSRHSFSRSCYSSPWTVSSVSTERLIHNMLDSSSVDQHPPGELFPVLPRKTLD